MSHEPVAIMRATAAAAAAAASPTHADTATDVPPRRAEYESSSDPWAASHGWRALWCPTRVLDPNCAMSYSYEVGCSHWHHINSANL